MVSDPAQDPGPFLDPTSNFANIFNINFTFVFPSFKFVKLHIKTRYNFFREFIFFKLSLC